MTNRIVSYKALEKQFLPKAKGPRQKERVRDLLNLYSDGKVFSKITMQRELNRYLGRFKNESERDLYFFQSMAKHLNVQPSTDKRRDKRIKEKEQKLNQLIKKAEDRKPKARYTVKAILYSRAYNTSRKNGCMTVYRTIRLRLGVSML